MPAMTFIGSLVYVGTTVVGGPQVASGRCSWAMCRRSSSTPAGHHAAGAAGVHGERAAVGGGVRGAGVHLLDEDEESVEPAPSAGPVFGRGRLVFSNVSFSYSPEQPLISSLSLVAEPGQTVRL